MTRMMFAALMAVCALSMAVPAAAEEKNQTDERVATVRGRGLDLSKDADAAIMLQRLNRAAGGVCGGEEIARPSPATRRAMDACAREAVAQAVAELDAPALTRLHASAAATVAYRR